MHKKFWFIWACFLGIALFLTTCREKCSEAANTLIQVQFLNLADLQADTVAFQSVRGITPNQTLIDSVLYNETDSLSIFLLPTASERNEVDFLFTGTNRSDTLRLAYDRQMEVIIPDCGISEVFSNLRILFHTFDSARISNQVIEDGSQVHIQIFQN